MCTTNHVSFRCITIAMENGHTKVVRAMYGIVAKKKRVALQQHFVFRSDAA